MEKQSQRATAYTTRGSVRGSCGHQHKSIRTAWACARRDGRACVRYNGQNAYSDRNPVRVDGCDFTPDEEAEFFAEMSEG